MSPLHTIHGTTDRMCVKHGKRLKAGETCPLCPRKPSAEAATDWQKNKAWEASVEAMRPASKGKPKCDGSHAEEALYAALDKEGYLDLVWMEQNAEAGSWLYADLWRVYERGFPWGLYLTPRRRFQSDAAFPSKKLLIEVDGQSHSIKARRHGDVRKTQLAEAAGWRVLRLLPEQVHNGEAVQLIAAALAARNLEVPK